MAETDKFSTLLIDKSKQLTKQSSDYMNVYANNVHMAMSLFDASLIFGEIVGEEVDGKNVVNQKVRIILSKEMTKVLAELLVRNVRAYEAQFGEIVVPQPQPKPKPTLASAAKAKKSK